MTKIHINLSQGLIEVEGEEEFVKSVYGDLKEVIAKKLSSSKAAETAHNSDEAVTEESSNKSKTPKRRSSKKSSETTRSKTQAGYAPKLDASLPIADLDDFYSPYDPSNQSERILIFCKYIQSVTENDLCTVDQIYTCYSALKEKHPIDYMQAMRDARKRAYGYVTYTTPEDVKVTLIGENFFNKKLKRKPGQE